ncbi:hypothetical protein [Herpetosiphon geysericola]|uniref:hypothetical protein n=1 Tax=Herpetosiphon geysericola TaxID=70996 RepID=UPI0006C909CA|nr:hypothetical protein [Herpetosiphon geysericola]
MHLSAMGTFIPIFIIGFAILAMLSTIIKIVKGDTSQYRSNGQRRHQHYNNPAFRHHNHHHSDHSHPGVDVATGMYIGQSLDSNHNSGWSNDSSSSFDSGSWANNDSGSSASFDSGSSSGDSGGSWSSDSSSSSSSSDSYSGDSSGSW